MKPFNTAFLILFISILASCKKSNPPTGGNYPRQVNIVYKVSSATASSVNIVQYRNETGGITDSTNTTLPFTKNITRSVNKNDVLSLGYGTNSNQTVKLEMLVNNVSMKSQTFTATAGAITYLFE